MSKTIAIDFDGVIHAYSGGWKDGSIYDQPVPGAFEFIQSLFEAGYSVYIHSTRRSSQIKKWLDWHIMVSEYEAEGLGGDPTVYKYTRYGYTCSAVPFWKRLWTKRGVLGISRRKLPAICYIDDRAMRFNGQFDGIKDEIMEFKTYQGV